MIFTMNEGIENNESRAVGFSDIERWEVISGLYHIYLGIDNDYYVRRIKESGGLPLTCDYITHVLEPVRAKIIKLFFKNAQTVKTLAVPEKTVLYFLNEATGQVLSKV